MLLMIDNYDCSPTTSCSTSASSAPTCACYRNDAITRRRDRGAGSPTRIVISPGPCTPNEAGISVAADPALRRRDPDPRRVPRPPGDRAGVRRPDRARAARDARQALADHARRPRRVRRPAVAVHRRRATTRWRSSARRCPPCLEVTATADDGEIMGVRHRELAVEGVQFHPEAILTEHGHALLRNFLEALSASAGSRGAP